MTQPEFNLDITPTAKKSRKQKEEDKRYQYQQQLFESRLHQMSKVWNGGLEAKQATQ